MVTQLLLGFNWVPSTMVTDTIFSQTCENCEQIVNFIITLFLKYTIIYSIKKKDTVTSMVVQVQK